MHYKQIIQWILLINEYSDNILIFSEKLMFYFLKYNSQTKEFQEWKKKKNV